MAARNQKNKRSQQKKKKRSISVGMATLVRRLPNLHLPSQQKVLINPPEHEKMSEVILEFAQH